LVVPQAVIRLKVIKQ